MAPFPSFLLRNPDIFPEGNTLGIIIETQSFIMEAGRPRVIELALLSQGRHVNYIFYFRSLPRSRSLWVALLPLLLLSQRHLERAQVAMGFLVKIHHQPAFSFFVGTKASSIELSESSSGLV